MRVFFVFVFIFCSFTTLAQSRRVAPQTPAAAPTPETVSVKEMFDEANTYNKKKFAEFEQKKIPVSESLIQQTQRERKQLAARHAAAASRRTDLASEEIYYLGMLQWIADNLDATRETFEKYLTGEDLPNDKAQDARAVIAAVYARQRKFVPAQRALQEYLSNSPVRLNQRAQIEKDIAMGLLQSGDVKGAEPFASAAYDAYKAVTRDMPTRERFLDELIDSGFSLFKIHRQLGDQAKADATLDDMKKTAVDLQAANLWYFTVDKQITYQIETRRKPQALAYYTSVIAQFAKDIPQKHVQTELVPKLRKREKHYRMLNEVAPELLEINGYLYGERRSLADLRGKIVLLDFWATWCAPCIEAFPIMREWQRELGPQGFAIFGITRFYGMADGMPADKASETDFLRRFAQSQGLTYDIAVANDETNHRAFGASAIPTAVLIDRRGVIRYIETGSSPYRLQELKETIMQLLSEK